MRIARIILLFLIASLNFIGCSSGLDKDGYYRLNVIDDATILPYRFVAVEWQSFNARESWIPVDFYGHGEYGICIIGHSWQPPPDTVSAVIFYSDILRKRAITQHNIKTVQISSSYPCDLDSDGYTEFAIVYYYDDSLWLEIFHIEKGILHRQFLATGKDIDSNGYWDGGVTLCDAYDFNDDGKAELILNVDTGYDLYPRRIVCVDWYNNKILWEYNHAGIINVHNITIDPTGNGGRPIIILGISSKGNAAVARDMDDRHSYVIILDQNGKELWKKETGGTFTNGMPVMINYNNDDSPDIFVSHIYRERTHDYDTSTVEAGYIAVYNIEGELLDSLNLGPNRVVNAVQLLDLDDDNINEVFLSMNDKSIIILDQKLNIVKQCKLYTRCKVWDCRDFLGLGNNQLLIGVSDNQLILTDTDFKPLAGLLENYGFSYGDYYLSQRTGQLPPYYLVLNNSKARYNGVYVFEKSPWYTIFSRRPILAFMAAFIPLSLIIGIIYLILTGFRHKNKIISEQKDRLNHALVELKEMQQKLIAAEKYRQAKDIAGGVAHEIHNALYPAIGSLDKLSQLLEKVRFEDNDRLNRLFELISKSINRANSMTELVSRYSRLEMEKKVENVILDQLIRQIIDENSLRMKELDLSVSTDILSDYRIKCYQPHAYSLFNNLMINALDALAGVEKRGLAISATRNNDEIEIIFSDSGIGIEPDKLPRIFDAFFSTKPKTGTGLGLAMVKKIVELYDGRIEVQSTLDKGTKFIIFLPEADSIQNKG